MVCLDVAKEAAVLARFGDRWLRALRVQIYAQFEDFFDRACEFASGPLEIIEEDLSDRELVLELVAMRPEAVRHLKSPLLRDHAVVLTALSIDGSAVQWLGEFERDLFVKALAVVPDVEVFLETHCFTFGFLHEDVPEVGIWLLKCGVHVSHLRAELFQNRDFVAMAMQAGGRVSSQVFVRVEAMVRMHEISER